jgi:hypothetical protein
MAMDVPQPLLIFGSLHFSVDYLAATTLPVKIMLENNFWQGENDGGQTGVYRRFD